MRVPSVFRHPAVVYGLLVVGVALLVAPALFPLDPVLAHDTTPGTTANATQLEEQGVPVVAYEDLSPRGQELYVDTLLAGGYHTVSRGQGASDFDYATDRGIRDARGQRVVGAIAIERPPDSDLPRPQEPTYRAGQLVDAVRERGGSSGGQSSSGASGARSEGDVDSIEEAERQIVRYDLMSTRTARPSPADTSALVRLLSAVVGIFAIGVGGYRASLP